MYSNDTLVMIFKSEICYSIVVLRAKNLQEFMIKQRK